MISGPKNVYVSPPVAVSVMAGTAQLIVPEATSPAVGRSALWLTTAKAVAVQPLSAVTTTEYVPGLLTLISASVSPFDHR